MVPGRDFSQSRWGVTRGDWENLPMRILGAVLTVLFGAPFLWCAWAALSSRFGPPEADMHGYGLVFGSLFAVALAVPLALSVPLVAPKPKRWAVMRLSLLAMVVVQIGLLAVWFTA